MPEQLALPRVYRPLGARLAAVVAAVTLLTAMVVPWLLLPDDVRAGFTPAQRITVVVSVVVILFGLYGFFRTAAVADPQGLTVVNGYHTRRFQWAELVRISLTTHRPWALVDLADGSTVSVMAIQTADGDRATSAVRELATVLADRTRTERDT